MVVERAVSLQQERLAKERQRVQEAERVREQERVRERERGRHDRDLGHDYAFAHTGVASPLCPWRPHSLLEGCIMRRKLDLEPLAQLLAQTLCGRIYRLMSNLGKDPIL